MCYGLHRDVHRSAAVWPKDFVKNGLNAMHPVVSEIAQLALASSLNFYLYLKNYMSVILFTCDSDPYIDGKKVNLSLCLIK
jgi:hypothetical protein